MKIFFQIMQTAQNQQCGTLIFNIDNQKYFFNIAEPFHRFMKHHQIKLTQGQKFFFTRISSETVSGIFPVMTDMFQTNQSLDNQFYGPQNITKMFQSVKFKFFRKILPYSFYDFATQEKILGVNNNEELNKFVANPNFTQNFYFSEDFNAFLSNSMDKKFVNDSEQNIQDNNLFDKYLLKNQQKVYRDKYTHIIPLFTQNERQVSYLIVPNKVDGGMNKDKLKEFKIEGKLVGELQKKGLVEIDGKVIKLEDIKYPEQPSPAVLIVDIQNIQQMQEFIESYTNLFQHIQQDSQNIQMKAIVHMCSVQVAASKEYSQFVKIFGKNCQNVYVGLNRYSNLKEEKEVEVDHHVLTNILASNFPSFFETLDEQKQVNLKFENQASNNELEFIDQFKQFKNNHFAKKNYIFNIVPEKSFGYAKRPQEKSEGKKKPKDEEYFHVKAFQQELSEQTELIQYLEEQKQNSTKNKNKNGEEQKQNENKNEKFDMDIDPEITVLGTSCMKPTILRNVSGYLIQHKKVNVLLDAGDGTYHQLLNHFGEQALYDHVLENLQIVFISHYHSDHYLGFQQILVKRNEILKAKNITNRPLYLLVPFIAAPWISSLEKYFDEKLDAQVVFLQQLEKAFDPLQTVEVIEQKIQDLKNKEKEQTDKLQQQQQKEKEEEEKDNQFVNPVQKILQQEIIDKNFGNLELSKLNFQKFLLESNLFNHFLAVPVIHCQQAYGIVIEYNSNYLEKISYSGDTRPCEEFIEKAKNSTLMIHEATFSDDFENADQMSHSTLTQAITAGYTSLSEKLLLTHFSQRYKKIDLHKFADEYDKQFYDYLNINTAMAFDHLHFRLSDFSHLPAMTRTAMHLLPNE